MYEMHDRTFLEDLEISFVFTVRRWQSFLILFPPDNTTIYLSANNAPEMTLRPRVTLHVLLHFGWTSPPVYTRLGISGVTIWILQLIKLKRLRCSFNRLHVLCLAMPAVHLKTESVLVSFQNVSKQIQNKVIGAFISLLSCGRTFFFCKSVSLLRQTFVTWPNPSSHIYSFIDSWEARSQGVAGGKTGQWSKTSLQRTSFSNM